MISVHEKYASEYSGTDISARREVEGESIRQRGDNDESWKKMCVSNDSIHMLCKRGKS